MSQIININIGKAGVRIGQKFWEKVGREHFNGQQQIRGRPAVFFNQTKEKQYQSRSVFLDIDPRIIQRINLKTEGYSLSKKNMFKGSGLYSDLFPTGKYFQGAQIVDESFDKVRREAQKCDLLSGFLVLNSIAGGTGSGMTAQMLSKLRESYCSNIVQQHFLLPDIENMCNPLHIYNAVFSTHYSIQQTDVCIMAQNSAINKRIIADQNLRPTINEINDVHAQDVTEITAPYRFSGSLNTNQRKTCTNLILFPRIKFLVSSCSNKKQRSYYLEDAFNPINFSLTSFFNDSPGLRDIYTMQVNCRDNFAYESEIDSKVRIWMQGRNRSFIEWLPNNIHLSISDQVSATPSATMLLNSRHVVSIFKKWSDIFTTQFRRRAFVYHYLGCGMDEMEFTEAQSNLNDLISEHIPYDHQPYNDYDEIEQAPQ